MGFTETLRLVVDADTKGAVAEVERFGKASQREISKSEKSLDRWGHRLSSVGAGLIGFGTVAAAGLGLAAQSAADLEQSVGGTEAVFGSARGVIDDYAANAADKLGLSERAFRELTTTAGAQLKNLGFSVSEAADQSIRLTEIGADLAATYGGTTQEAVEALGAAFRGEADPAERFGLSLNQTAVNAKAVEMGLADSTSEVDANAKAQATLALITEQSADAQGQFAREADTAAGRQQRLNASFEDLKAKIGTAVLPVMNTLVDTGGDVVGMFTRLDESTGGLVGKIATFGTIAVLAAGGVSTLAGKLITARDTLRDLPTWANRTATALGAIGVALTAIEVITSRRESRAQSWVEDIVGDTGSLSEVRSAIRDVKAELDELDDREGKGRLFSVGDVNVFATGGDADRQSRIDALRESLADLEAQEESLVGQQAETASAYVGSDEALEGLNEQTARAVGELQNWSDAIAAQMDPLLGFSDALAANQEAQAAVTEAQHELNKAIEEHGPTSDEAREAQRKLDAAYRDATGSALDLTSAAAELEAGIEAGTVSVVDAKARLQQWVRQGLISQETARSMGRQFDIAALKAVALGGTDPHVSVTTSGLAHAIGQFDDLARAINNALNQAGAAGNVHVSVGGGGGFILHEGGIVPGPRGQEIAGVLLGGEEVLDYDDPRHAANLGRFAPMDFGRTAPWSSGSGSAGATYVENKQITIYTGADPQAVVEALKRYERSNGPIPVNVR